MIEKRLEAYLGGAWVDLTADLVGSPAIAWGQQQCGVLDRVAASGALTFALDNSEDNSVGIIGRYSPQNANRLPGWQKGVQIRFTLVDGPNLYVKHRGWLRKITAKAGERGTHPVECVSRTWFDQAARHQVRGIGTLVDKRVDEAAQALVDQIPIPPYAVNFDVCSDVAPFLFEDLRGGSYLNAFSRLVFTEMGYGYELADGTVRLEARTRRFNPATPAITLDGAWSLDAEEDQAATTNLVRATIAPRDQGTGLVITLAALKKAVEIAPGETVTLELQYVDPNQKAAHVGGFAMVAPDPAQDYVFNAAADGTGTGLTASLGVVAEFEGDRVRLSLTNSHPSTKGFVTKFEVRGKGLFTYQPVSFESRDQALIDDSGEISVEVAMPYQEKPNVARSVADYVLSAWKDPGHTAVTATFCAEASDNYPDELVAYDVGSLVGAADSVLGLNGLYWINGVEVRFQEPGITWVTWYLTKADVGLYWELGVVGRSELGVTTFMGPY